ncbi:putative Ig domain-containing protein [Caulobacter mirabilis]|uniref:putative Ig domain-containing protein n=1 Tax=Caulobacter mirabilis TaxID=69666 RepID=UPI001C0ED3CB|nr:putative Ig domain-containing protein [Caulobacter mirabilis]
MATLLIAAFSLLIMIGAASPAGAATFPCAIDSNDIAGLTFVNPQGTSSDPNSYALVGVLTRDNVSATTGGCNGLPSLSIRPLVGATPTATNDLPVAGATAQGGWLVRITSNEVRYLPPSHSFSGTDSFTIDNNNNTRVITVTVNVLAAPPTVTGISPASGSGAGGTAVVITGTSFTGATAVTFGGVSAQSFTVDGPTQITATSPAGTGTVDVRVTTAAGTSAVVAADQFTYSAAPPTVTGLSPTNGPTGGGNTVVITGTNFTGVSAVTFGAAPAMGFTFISATQINATAPANSAGTYDVTVTTPGGTSATTAADQYTYVSAPTVTAVSPSAGPTGGGATVIITGANLSGATAVTFGGTAATGYTVNGPTQITATAPAGAAGTVDVRVTTVGGTSATSVNDFYTYVAAPTVSSITPTSGPTAGGTTVVITGTGFSAAPGTGAVKFGASNASYTINSNTQITATSPANMAGTYDITVTTPGGTSATSAQDEFTYVPTPTVTAVSPTAGSTAGGTTVVITGTNLSNATAVTFGGTAATGYTINGPTQITATTPPHASGVINVRVTTVGGTSATSANDQYTFVAPPVASSQTYGSIVAYNDGANATTNIDLSLYLTGGDAPTSYAVGSATTAQGGSVTVNSSGIATYTPPVGYRNANDAFTYTATNLGGTSAPATVTVTIGNPTLSLTLPSSTATVERPYNAGATPVTVSGGRASYTINSISGLPSGLSAAGGVISGTPAVNGTFTVTANVTDSSLGAGPYNANITATLMVSLPPAPVVSSFSISGLTYNSGSATATTFSALPHATESPTGFQVGASSYGGTVSVDSAGLMSYTPPLGFRGTDTFNYVATNAGGTSNVAQVFVTVNDPVFSATLPAATGTVGQAYNSGASVVAISGGHAPFNNFSATGLPAGLTMDSSGVISGTPTTATNATVVVTVTDSSGGNGSYTSTASATLTIDAPTIVLSPASGALPGGPAGAAYGQTITSNGGFAPVTFAVTAGAPPPGLALSGGVISGTPTATGTYNFTVTGTDSSGNAYTGSASYSITVTAPAITVSPPILSSGSVGLAYSEALAASNGTAPYSFALDSGTLPAGVTIDGAGLISGTPTEGGSFPIAVRVTDSTTGGTYSAIQNYTLNIGAPSISLTPGSLANGAIAASYNQSVSASGGTAPYSYAVTAGSLPPGLALSTSGDITGTPTGGGTYNFTVTATDSSTGAGAPYTGSSAYSITVDAPTISLSPTTLAPAAVGASVSQTIVATGGTSGYAYAVTAGALPAGVTLSPSGLLSGTPTEAGSFNVTITATDSSTGTGAPFTGSQAYSWNIGAATISLSPGSLANGAIAASYSQTISATGGTASYGYAITAGSLPPGLALSTSGDITGTPTGGGTYNFTITATDSSTGVGAPFTGSSAYSITVDAPTISLSPTTLVPAVVGASVNQTIVATGGTSGYAYAVTAGALPAGVTLSPGGVLSGTPTEAGSFNVTITATDSSTGTGAPYTGSQAYSWSIGAPSISMNPTTLPAGVQHDAYSQSITAAGGTAPYSYSLASGSLPTGVTLSPSGLLSGAPTVVGTFNITVRATDSTTGGGPFSIDTPYSLVVGVPNPPTAGPVSLTVAANSGANAVTPVLGGPPTVSVAVDAAPAHGTASASGLNLVYTPTAGYSGTDSFTYTATNLGGTSAPATVTVTVTPPVLALNDLTPATGTALAAYTATLTASAGAAPYGFALDSGTLPAGVTLSAGGAVSGTPTQAGSFAFTVKATDVYGATGTRAYSLEIAAPTIALTPAAGALPGGLRTVAYSQTITASGGAAPYGYTVTAGTLPAGLTLTTAGVLSGTPTTAGGNSFTVTATDAYGFSQSAAYTLAVGTPAATVQPKTVAVIGGQSVTIDAAQGATGLDLIAAQVATPPSHGTAVANGLTITYTANGAYAGPDSFTYTVTNPGGVSAPATVTITVNPAVVPGPDKTATIMAGQTATVELTQGAFGAPFTGAAVVSVSPASAGTATITGRVAGGQQLYDLAFKPDNAFTGDAVVLYTLSNAFATSVPGKVTITVKARPDPAQDAEVTGLIAAQGETARRFASAQIGNFNRRLEQLHGGGEGGGGFSSSLSLNFGGSGLSGGLANDPSELRRMQDRLGVTGALTGRDLLGFDQPSEPQRRAEDVRTSGAGGGAGGGSGPWGVWASGAATFGRTDDGRDREGFKFSTDGLTIGVDRRLSEKLVLGVGVGWATDTSKIGDHGTRSEADAWSLSVYGSFQPVEKAYVDLVLGYGKLDFDSKRYVTANGQFAYGQRDGDQWFGAVTAGWDYRHPHGLKLSPYGRIEASRSTLGAFTETGGGAFALAYEEQTTNTVTGAIGLRGEYALKTRFGRAIPSFRIEYAYDLQGSGSQQIRYADWLDGKVYSLDASPLDRNRMLYGLGLDLLRKSGARFGLDYEGMLSGDQTSGTVRLRLETDF